MAKKPAMKKDKAMNPKAKAGLTAGQKKLPPALQAAILKKSK